MSAVTSRARTVAETAILKFWRGVQVAVSTATMLLTPTPFTAPNCPPAYRVPPSGESARARTVAVPEDRVNDRLHPVGAPVAASNAAKLTAGSSEVPAAASGGRTVEKVPPA